MFSSRAHCKSVSLYLMNVFNPVEINQNEMKWNTVDY